MAHAFRDQLDHLDAALRTAQYLAGLTTHQDLWAETGTILLRFFGAEACAIAEADAEGGIRTHHWSLVDPGTDRAGLEAAAAGAAAEVLESGFLSLRTVTAPEPWSLVALAVPMENQAATVLVVGHRGSEAFTRAQLNLYLAVAGLVGTSAARLASERELRDHRQNLEAQVKARTGELTRTNQRLILEIEKHRQAQAALREALAFNMQVISSAQEGIVVYDLEGRLVLFNAFMEKLSGLVSRDEAGRTQAEVFPFLAAAGDGRSLLRALQGERVVNPSFPWAAPASGISGWASSTLAPLAGGQGEAIGVIETVTDLSDWHRTEQQRAQLQAELQHIQKLESLGRLAGGVAHDMNNVLGAIYAVAQTVRARHGGIPDLDQALATVERAAVRGRDLVKGLLGFTRKDLAAPVAIDINDLIRQEMALLERTLMQKCRLEMDLEEPLAPVLGESGALGSTLMNLCVNAVDAMPGGGRLTIRTRGVAGPAVEITVADTGLGMSPEVLAKAMEPFFTTKAMGKGTGLGLSQAFNTARAHRGSLALHSTEGRGTQAVLRLPCMAGAAAPAGAAPAPAPGRPALAILMVDDDELLRASIPSMLAILGHRVEAVAGGAAALSRLDAGMVPDLVILDLNMPDMNGLETLRGIRARRPDLPVLLATGFLEPAAAAAIEADPHARSISKPFSLAEIQARLGLVEEMRG